MRGRLFAPCVRRGPASASSARTPWSSVTHSPHACDEDSQGGLTAAIEERESSIRPTHARQRDLMSGRSPMRDVHGPARTMTVRWNLAFAGRIADHDEAPGRGGIRRCPCLACTGCIGDHHGVPSAGRIRRGPGRACTGCIGDRDRRVASPWMQRRPRSRGPPLRSEDPTRPAHTHRAIRTTHICDGSGVGRREGGGRRQRVDGKGLGPRRRPWSGRRPGRDRHRAVGGGAPQRGPHPGARWQRGHQYVRRGGVPWLRLLMAVPQRRHGRPVRR